LVECQADEAKHILSNDPSGSCLRDNAEHLRPEIAVISLAVLLPGDAERLTGEPSSEKGCSEVFGSVEFADIIVDRHLRPVFFEHPLREWLSLTEANRFETRPSGGEREPANPRKEIEMCESVL
jgi:hypothetical protein